MKMLKLVGALVVALAAFTAVAQEIDVGGTYVGTYTASKAPGEHDITIVFRQDGINITSHYHTSTGVDGIGWGVISGNVAKMKYQNTTPSCPGTYSGIYTFSESSVTWTYSGQDCLGDEKGEGNADKVNSM